MSRLNENDRKIWPKFAKYVHFFPQEDETNIHFCMYVLTYTQSLHFLFVSNRDGSSLNLTFLLRKCSRCILTFVEKRRLSPTLIASRLPKIKHEYLRSRAYICLSLSSPFSSVIASQIWPLSRYSCCYLGSLHPRNFQKNVCSSQIFIFCAFGATAGNNRTFDFVFPPNLRPLPQATYLWCAKNYVGHNVWIHIHFLEQHLSRPMSPSRIMSCEDISHETKVFFRK